MTGTLAYSFHYVIRSSDLHGVHTGGGTFQRTKYVEINSSVVEKISSRIKLLSLIKSINLVRLRVSSISFLLDSCTSWSSPSLIVKTV